MAEKKISASDSYSPVFYEVPPTFNDNDNRAWQFNDLNVWKASLTSSRTSLFMWISVISCILLCTFTNGHKVTISMLQVYSYSDMEHL